MREVNSCVTGDVNFTEDLNGNLGSASCSVMWPREAAARVRGNFALPLRVFSHATFKNRFPGVFLSFMVQERRKTIIKYIKSPTKDPAASPFHYEYF